VIWRRSLRGRAKRGCAIGNPAIPAIPALEKLGARA